MQRGKALTAQSVEARYCVRNDGPPRLGIAVSRRYARRATTRNAFKRQVREAFRDSRARLQAMDVVIRLRAPLMSHPRECRNEIRNLFAELCRER
ncbi:MAG: ribonuclease P protein component [Burkholderiales bacterium]